MNSVNDLLSSLKLKHEREEADLVARWKERSKKMWEKIEGAIKFEEEKVRVKLEKERKLKEEEEKKRKAEELKRRIAEEKRKAEEERKRKEEEEEQKRQAAEEEERKKAEEVERKKAEQLAKEAEERKALGMATAEEDWIGARSTLKVSAALAVYSNRCLPLFAETQIGPHSRYQKQPRIEEARQR